MSDFGVCICDGLDYTYGKIDKENIKIEKLDYCNSYEDAVKKYIELAFTGSMSLDKKVWLVFIEGDDIVQFEQLERKVRCKVVPIRDKAI